MSAMQNAAGDPQAAMTEEAVVDVGPPPAGGTEAALNAESATPGAEAPAAAGVEPLAELQARAAKAAENWERFVRAKADLENYKKRATRERQDAVRFANAAAAISVTRMGAQPSVPTRAEILLFLARQS